MVYNTYGGDVCMQHTVFLATADQMTYPSSSLHDRKLLRVTKCTHLQVVGLRLEGNLVF